MSQTKYILSLDQGTTSSRAILFDNEQNIVCVQQREFEQIYPQSGLGGAQPHGDLLQPVRRDERGDRPERRGPRGHCGHRHHQPARDHHPVGQEPPAARCTTPSSGSAAAPRPLCDELLKTPGMADYIRENTGLVPDAYFSATKIKWILDHVPGAREKAEAGELLFGTVDTWLVWKLTRRQGARYRPHQRQPHHALQHPHAGLGRHPAQGAGHPPLHPARA